jgi:hypothetical protein
LRVLKPQGLFAVAYVNQFEGYDKDKYHEIFLCYTPSDLDRIIARFDVTKMLNVPTDGPVFNELNDKVAQDPMDLSDLHTWLDQNRAVFDDPFWPRTSRHGLYVGRKA